MNNINTNISNINKIFNIYFLPPYIKQIKFAFILTNKS